MEGSVMGRILHQPTGSVGERSYTDEADVFVIHCPDTDRIYAVPVGEPEVLTEASLRVTPPANGQAKGIRRAADHELPT